jgi:hypothetical protein
VPRNLLIKWRFVALLMLTIFVTTSMKWYGSGRKDYDEQGIQSQIRRFLELHNAQLIPTQNAPLALRPIKFTFETCESTLIIVPNSDDWTAIIGKRTPAGQIVKFRYRDYSGDVLPKYQVMFIDMYQSLFYPILKENRREFSLALMATPNCMKVIESMPWGEVWMRQQ